MSKNTKPYINDRVLILRRWWNVPLLLWLGIITAGAVAYGRGVIPWFSFIGLGLLFALLDSPVHGVGLRDSVPGRVRATRKGRSEDPRIGRA